MTPLRLKVHVRGLAGFVCLIFTLLANPFPVAAQTAVTTYHNDNFRTGWNSHETTLTPANVNATQFGPLASVTVDDQVDAQPLLVPGVNIRGYMMWCTW
jgi:hypothetical protein